jgi:hypothetical protein
VTYEEQVDRDNQEIAKHTQRYMRAVHQMQSGVAMLMNFDGVSDPEHKHLRVGVNSALVINNALTQLFISKGVITLAEYTKASADAMEEEVERYRTDLQQRISPDGATKIDLG